MTVDEIIVPLDGGATSLQALPVARSLADRLGAQVTAVTVTPPWIDAGPALDWLDARAGGVGAGTIAIVAPHAGPALVELASESPGSVLCMTSQGRSGVRQVVLGSVSGDVVRSSPRPVLVVGPHARPPVGSGVLVCVHGPPERVGSPAAAWTSALGGPAWVVAVTDAEEVLAVDTPAGYETDAVAEMVRAAGRSAEVLVLHGRDVGDQLLQAASRVEPGIVIADTHARVGAADIVLPSVARRLVREAACPVLLVGPACREPS